MCAAPRAVKVTILGREYAFASQGEEADAHVRRVAALVDERMKEVSRTATRQGPLQVAVLTGLELVDELLHLKQEVDSVEERIAERTSRLSSSLGQLLGDLGDESDETAAATPRRFELPSEGSEKPRFSSEEVKASRVSVHPDNDESSRPPTGPEGSAS